jgi:putative heme-binding domain-containing protein
MSFPQSCFWPAPHCVTRLGLFLFVAAAAVGHGQNPPAVAGTATNKATLTEYALRQQGDPSRGRQVFADETKAACLRCHTTDGQGVKAGPDLSAIADKFPRRELVRSILEPAATIAVGYGTTIVTTRDGEEVSGVIKQATASWIELVGGDGKPVRIAISDIKEQRTSDTSLMPEGFETTIKPQELVDLIAYLETLHQPIDSQTRIQGMPESIPQAVREVALQPVFDPHVSLKNPVWFGAVPGCANRFVVLEHGGKSWLIERTREGDQPKVLVDLTGQVRVGGATGFLGIAFHPKFAQNRKYYLKYQVLRDGQILTHLVERQFTADFKGDAGVAPRLLLEIGSVTQDHHGGTIEFGPDGFLYLGMGDSGPQRDPQGHGQDLNVFWSKILRLDVDRTESGRGYGIPRDNPFVGRANVRPEIWAYGFREPWRFSFDPVTGDLWVGDVGQDRVEEISIVRAGENHGWNVFEGHPPFSDQYRRAGEQYVAPVFSYWHRVGVSVTGGFVYRGKRAPLMQGRYLCGDFESRRIWALTQTNRLLASIIEIGRAPTRLVSFGQDHDGELYVVGYDNGVIYGMDLAAVDPTPRESLVIAATSEQSPVLWRYSLQSPTNGWFQPEFDDSAWQLSAGGFGTQGTPGAIVRTEWRTRDIWLRRVFTLANGGAKARHHSLALRLHHDEDVEIFLNGKEVAREPRWTTGYVELPLSAEAASALRPGRNVLAIHCRQNGGGQYVDAGLIEYQDPVR